MITVWVLMMFYLMNGVVVETYRYTGPGTPFKNRAKCEEVLQDATIDIARDKELVYGKDFTMKCEERTRV